MSYSGGMYPNVPTRRVGSDVLPTSVSFVNPKSATFIIKFSTNMQKRLEMEHHHEKNQSYLSPEVLVDQYVCRFNITMNINRDSMLMDVFKASS